MYQERQNGSAESPDSTDEVQAGSKFRNASIPENPNSRFFSLLRELESLSVGLFNGTTHLFPPTKHTTIHRTAKFAIPVVS